MMVECVHIEKELFLEALKVSEISNFILPLEYGTKTLEDLINEVPELDKVMYSTDMGFEVEELTDLLDNYDIKYTIEIQ
jgi:hypothetical protein